MMARLTTPFDERTGIASNIEIILDMLTNAGKVAGESNLPFLIAPAMNPVMWNSLHTRLAIHRLSTIYGHNFHVLPTVLKASMCGEIGYGNIEAPENIARYLIEALNRTIEPVPEELIDVPLPLFHAVDTWHENPGAVHSEGTNLKLEDMSSSALPYYECLRRVLGTWRPGEPFNILVTTEEHGSHSEHSSARSLSKSFKEDLMKTAALSVGKNRYVPPAITEKFVLAKQANSALPLFTYETPAAFEEQIIFTDADE
ncbi:hypothetical protein RvY_13453-2 [Ramazzottius varieornatus]|nr:hypothetical protein RvY_13453-2 [Ramazzottius varieornatus]